MGNRISRRTFLTNIGATTIGTALVPNLPVIPPPLEVTTVEKPDNKEMQETAPTEAVVIPRAVDTLISPFATQGSITLSTLPDNTTTLIHQGLRANGTAVTLTLGTNPKVMTYTHGGSVAITTGEGLYSHAYLVDEDPTGDQNPLAPGDNRVARAVGAQSNVENPVVVMATTQSGQSTPNMVRFALQTPTEVKYLDEFLAGTIPDSLEGYSISVQELYTSGRKFYSATLFDKSTGKIVGGCSVWADEFESLETDSTLNNSLGNAPSIRTETTGDSVDIATTSNKVTDPSSVSIGNGSVIFGRYVNRDSTIGASFAFVDQGGVLVTPVDIQEPIDTNHLHGLTYIENLTISLPNGSELKGNFFASLIRIDVNGEKRLTYRLYEFTPTQQPLVQSTLTPILDIELPDCSDVKGIPCLSAGNNIELFQRTDGTNPPIGRFDVLYQRLTKPEEEAFGASVLVQRTVTGGSKVFLPVTMKNAQ
ncbi:hypothetical protein JW962_02365 [Candidatus Dojkabacteria bacterium]|nr:hypothetical protein [Candidatus Dojkabacteria bacterium]